MGELIVTLDDYTIYKAYGDEAGNYYLCVPNKGIAKCQMFLGFADKEMEKLSKEEIVAMISEVNEQIFKKNKNSVYIVPDFPNTMLDDLTLENDDLRYKNFLGQKIQPITTDVYKMLVKNGIKPENINQTICVIERNERDKKLASWFAMLLGSGYVVEQDYKSLKDKTTGNDVKVENTMKDGNNQELKPPSDTGITPVNHQYDEINISKKNEKTLIRKPPRLNSRSSGFSSFRFIVVTLLLSLIFGVSIGYLLMK